MPSQEKDYDKFINDLAKYGNRIFSIMFRRENAKIVDGVVIAPAGQVRTMRCRLCVKKDVKGVQPQRREQDRQNGVITVYEMSGWDSGFKCIKISNIIAMSETE